MTATAPRPARTPRGARTRARLLEAAEHVFETVGYHEASIVKITEEAGVALGTFYVHFSGKKEIFDEVVGDLSHRVRQAMSEASSAVPDRIGAERAGFRAFFRFTAEHPALYRIIRQAEFVSPEAMQAHYANIVDGYAAGLAAARGRGDIRPVDPTVAAWALMGAGELIGMRWILWEQAADIPEDVYEALMDVVQGALAPTTRTAGPSLPSATTTDTRPDL
ncbi:TetR/AcrR family transcriptional regulator [Ornithinimicrobium tianjinense]|uniref:TetR family transcriptional regulator n=1 Tax=Ornithinimicrobium tianjinense TaxID=1195761 RepID=A0A917BWJ8_9MICO|nr:TetR/AcrR family transcriptional regulator [Ornithinimicrobium tianjinense]GGF59403.1 TetR family transcriptional regulator [Ornithinimicrobium tianjinense]